MRQAGEVLFCEILPEPGTVMGSDLVITQTVLKQEILRDTSFSWIVPVLFLLFLGL